MRVQPDVSGVTRTFDYRLPEPGPGPHEQRARRNRRDGLEHLAKGSIVKVPLAGRTVRGWAVEIDVEPPTGVEIREVSDFWSVGPPSEVVDLAVWTAWRYAGRTRPLLMAASPPRRVIGLPTRAASRARRPMVPDAGATATDRRESEAIRALVEVAMTTGSPPPSAVVIRLPPAMSRLETVLGVAEQLDPDRDLLVIVPTQGEATRLSRLLRGAGVPVSLYPEQWESAARGGSIVVGTRSSSFAPCPRLGAIVVLDAHSEVLTETRAPTWNAAVVATERARTAGVPCILVSPCPTLELLGSGALITPGRTFERHGWTPLEVIDRRGDDPRSGLYSERVVALVRKSLAEAPRPVVLVLNRTGRARLLACAACGALARCELCGAALGKGTATVGDRRREAAGQPAPGPTSATATGPAEGAQLDSDDLLRCGRGCPSRPPICGSCGSIRLKMLRIGTTRAAEELTALFGTDVVEVTARTAQLAPGRAYVGTEAVLHRVGAASLVVFLDFDMELLSPRLRAEENALALLAAASRLTAGRRRSGRVVVQTRIADHEVIAAALAADPDRVSEPELERRSRLRLPPSVAVAKITGAGAQALVADLESAYGIEAGEAENGYLVRAPTDQLLCDALAGCRSIEADARVEVDPLRL